MKLQNFLDQDTRYTSQQIAQDSELAHQIQVRLIALRLLDPPADGLFGPISTRVLNEFQTLTQCSEIGILERVTAKKLIEAKEVPPPKPDLSKNDLAARIVKYMLAKGYQVATRAQEYNIIYVEGMNPDGTLNADRPNEFNDLRMVIEFVAGVPEIAGCWKATTEPGRHYTENPMNPKGAARIQFGQYTAWRFGSHGASKHRALIQVEPINVYRDANCDYERSGDCLDTGEFGINQHWGYNYPVNDIGNASAGCLVCPDWEEHQEFLSIIEQDWRYREKPSYIFTTTIIPGDELVKRFPA